MFVIRYIRLLPIVIILSLFSFFYSCENEINEVEHFDRDSITKILLRIDADKKALLLDSLFTNYNLLGGFNGNVLVSQSGQVIFKKSYGYSNFKTKDSLKIDDTFQLASVSKQFTAVAILQLIEKGLINLNDTIQKFIPNFPYEDITIKLLLCHRSGLPNYIYFCDNLNINKEKGISNDSIIELLIQNKPPKYYSPNRKFDYSNTGYIVLAFIVEKVSKILYEDYLVENIFKPLDMNNSYVYNNLKKNNSLNKVQGYLFGEKEADDNFLNASFGDKGIYSSVEDIYKWEIGLYSNKIIKRETLQLAFEKSNPEMRNPKNYGYGWRIYELLDGKKMYYHRGWWQGFQNLLIRIEDDTTSVILLRNRKTKYIINQYDILNILYPERNYMSYNDIKNKLINKELDSSFVE